MNNTEREQLIKTKLQTKEWQLQCTKQGWKVKSKSGTVLAENASKHEALKQALKNTQSE